LALIAGGTLAVVAGGAFARARMKERGPAIPKPVTAIFPNGMAYLRWGTGPRTRATTSHQPPPTRWPPSRRSPARAGA